MEKNRIDELVAKYNEGLADPAEVKLLEQLIEKGSVDLTQLRELDKLDEQIVNWEGPQPSVRLDHQFYSLLAEEKRKARKNVFAFSWPDWNILVPRLAFALVLVIVGFGAGYVLERPSEKAQVLGLTKEISDLKEMVMLSLLEKESTTDRLRAVSLTSEMKGVSQKVTLALFKTLNEDDNVNVLLAALEALTVFARDNRVLEELVRSISKQDSPMVQLELAALMVAIQEKNSVKELQKIVESKKTPKEVKNKIKESIQVLI